MGQGILHPPAECYLKVLWPAVLRAGFLSEAVRSSWTGSLMESLGMD